MLEHKVLWKKDAISSHAQCPLQHVVSTSHNAQYVTRMTEKIKITVVKQELTKNNYFSNDASAADSHKMKCVYVTGKLNRVFILGMFKYIRTQYRKKVNYEAEEARLNRGSFTVNPTRFHWNTGHETRVQFAIMSELTSVASVIKGAVVDVPPRTFNGISSHVPE